MQRYDEENDGIWSVHLDGRIEGAIAIDGIDARFGGAHLRWFIASERLRGQGMGKRLLAAAMEFCRMREYQHIYLWTFEGLDAARHLYEKSGFVLVQQKRARQWGREVNEQRFEWHRMPVSESVPDQT